jgi:chromosome segregation ATPase
MRQTTSSQTQRIAELEAQIALPNQSQLSHIRALEVRVATTTNELDVYKRSVQHAKHQVSTLQELLAEREADHRQSTIGLVKIDGKEVMELVNRATDNVETKAVAEQSKLHDTLHHQEQAYARLEAEFRDALRCEMTRYTNLHTSYTSTTKRMAELKQNQATLTWNERHLKTMLAELTKMVKQQQTTIEDLTTTGSAESKTHKQTIELHNKVEQEHKLEKHRADALTKDIDKLLSRISGLENVVQGLRDERGETQCLYLLSLTAVLYSVC